MPSTTLSELPVEITEAILSEISHPQNLVQLASTSSFFRDLIIPRHTEYRILRLNITSSGQFDYLWTHLLQRPNLTRNISKVDVTDALTANHSVQVASGKVPLYPKTLVVVDYPCDYQSDDSQIGKWQDTEGTMLSTLRLMVNLKSLTWRWDTHPPTPDFLGFIFNIPSIEHVCLILKCQVSPATNEFSVNPPKHSPVRSLRIEGRYWTNRLLLDPVLSWFQTLTSLRTLKICSQLLRQCDGMHFPAIRELMVFMADDRCPAQIISFLVRHEMVELLEIPCGFSTIPSGILTNLKNLRCRLSFLQAMSKADTEDGMRLLRPIEHLILIEPRWFKDQDLQLFETGFLDQNKLQRLALRRIESVNSLKTLAHLFPVLQNLRFGQFYSKDPDMVELIPVLQLFKDLKALRCRPLWDGLPDENYEDKLTERIEVFANALPKLHQFGHPSEPDKQIIITRGESVTYDWNKARRWLRSFRS